MVDTAIVVGFAIAVSLLISFVVTALSGSPEPETPVETEPEEPDTETLTCPRCRAETDVAVSFCPECGKDLT